MKYQTIVTAVAEGVATLTLNCPEKRNAMSPRMHEEVTDALDDLRYNDEAAVVVITGAGNSFCAGMDLKEFFHELKVEKPREFDRIFRLATEWRGRTLRQYPKPTIAMVNGYCFGGAFSIVEGCDLAVAADEATFGLSEINFRAFPGGSRLQVAREHHASAGRVVLRDDRRHVQRAEGGRNQVRQHVGSAGDA